MDGVLVIDKPAGPTSHDVVARMRRALGEPRIGHTGTLDPMATGVLALVVGRATRLARFLAAGEKAYDATIRLGVATTTCDADGEAIGAPWAGPLPSREAIDAALGRFRGTFEQQPPAFSAKKIDGVRSYRKARAAERDGTAAEPPPAVPVTLHAAAVVAVDGDAVTLRLTCSAGFYVRSLAHDLGAALGTGAHLSALRRTRSGGFSLDLAVPLDVAERDPRVARAALVPMAAALPGLPAIVLSGDGVLHAIQGRELGPGDLSARAPSPGEALAAVAAAAGGDEPGVRLLDEAGDLVGLAGRGRSPGVLHPSLVLK